MPLLAEFVNNAADLYVLTIHPRALCTGSQFHALQQRIDEVEAQLALALANTPSSTTRSRSHSAGAEEDNEMDEWAYKGDTVGEATIGRLEGKLHGCVVSG